MMCRCWSASGSYLGPASWKESSNAHEVMNLSLKSVLPLNLSMGSPLPLPPDLKEILRNRFRAKLVRRARYARPAHSESLATVPAEAIRYSVLCVAAVWATLPVY
jgi:hypothetical protein